MRNQSNSPEMYEWKNVIWKLQQKELLTIEEENVIKKIANRLPDNKRR